MVRETPPGVVFAVVRSMVPDLVRLRHEPPGVIEDEVDIRVLVGTGPNLREMATELALIVVEVAKAVEKEGRACGGSS